MKKSNIENAVFSAVALILISGLILFGCSRSEIEKENAAHDHQDHTHSE